MSRNHDLRLAGVVCRAGILLCVATPAFSLRAQVLSAGWVELGEAGQKLARIVVTTVQDCPTLIVNGKSMAMAPRLPAPDNLRIVCQASIPPGTKSASVNGQALSLPRSNPKRVVVFGDTGCRIKGQRVQDCNDPEKWPFLQVAGDSLSERPDLVIHVGDYLYRESPCPPGSEAKCGGTPAGDNWEAWNADFFTPASKLLSAVPWVFTRGNHESCARSWRGWFYYLDPRDWTGVCQDYTKPYVIRLGVFQLAVLDTAEVKEDQLDEPQVSAYTSQLASLHVKNAWLVDHHPFWALKPGQAAGTVTPICLPLKEAWRRSTPTGIDLILSGHIHLFELVTLDTHDGRHPPQLVAGDGGTELAAPIPLSLNGILVHGDYVASGDSLHQWGHILLVRRDGSWQLALKSHPGLTLLTCSLSGGAAKCQAPERSPSQSRPDQ